MLTARHHVILRQILRPPYLYRWAGLVTVVMLFATTTALVLSDTGRPDRSSVAPDLAVTRAGEPAGRTVAPVLGPHALPAIVPALLSATSASGRREVALTFDDGPDPAFTPAVLDLLAAHRAPATFCMVGQQAVTRPDLVRRVVADGHRLCDHTFTHDADVGTHAPDLLATQLRTSHETLESAAGGESVDYFRAPEGRWTPQLQEAAAREGMRPLGWSVDSLDWTRPGTPAILATMQTEMHPGAVVLLHDGGGPRQQSVDALAELLPWLEQQGYRFVLPT